MHIPQEYGRFLEPTLIVATDSEKARLFLAKENIVEEVAVIDSRYPPRENIERASGQTPGGSHFSEQSETIKVISREKLYRALSEDLMHRLQNNEFSKLIIAVPEEHLNELQESLHIKLIKITEGLIPKLLTGEDMLDIVIHAHQSMEQK